jgi:hypothetical protein
LTGTGDNLVFLEDVLDEGEHRNRRESGELDDVEATLVNCLVLEHNIASFKRD